MLMTVVCAGVSACVLAAATVTHAATPNSQPFGDFRLHALDIDLPVPPPPPAVDSGAYKRPSPGANPFDTRLDVQPASKTPCARVGHGNRQQATGNRSS